MDEPTRKPQEASGTSGMKAAHNGVPSFSTIDGWVDEVPKESNGERRGVWSIGSEPDAENEDDFDSLCYKLKHEVRPTFARPKEMAREMKGAIKNASHFNSHRMVKNQIEKSYGMSIKDVTIK